MSEGAKSAEAKRYTVRNYVDPVKLKADMSYSMADLSTAMIEQAALFVHYGVLASKAAKQVDDLKMLLEVTESKVGRKTRDNLASDGVKSTEAQIANLVQTHSQVITLRKALNEARQIEAVAKTAVEGFRHRRDMLVQAGLISREEMKGEVSINRRRAADDEAEALKTRTLARFQQNKESES